MRRSAVPVSGQTCVDIKDNVVDEGFYFTPKGDDPCLSCTCHGGEPEMCVAALCERPQGCQQYRKDPKECCKFMCLDPGEPAPGAGARTGRPFTGAGFHLTLHWGASVSASGALGNLSKRRDVVHRPAVALPAWWCPLGGRQAVGGMW